MDFELYWFPKFIKHILLLLQILRTFIRSYKECLNFFNNNLIYGRSVFVSYKWGWRYVNEDNSFLKLHWSILILAGNLIFNFTFFHCFYKCSLKIYQINDASIQHSKSKCDNEPIKSYIIKENHICSVVSKIL